MVTVLLRETNDVAGDDDAPAPRLLETLPAAWADAVAIQSPAMAAVEGAAEATWAVFVVSGGSVLGFWRRNGREVRVEVEVKGGKKKNWPPPFLFLSPRSPAPLSRSVFHILILRSAETLELAVPARASPTKGAIEAVGEILRGVCFLWIWQFVRGEKKRASLTSSSSSSSNDSLRALHPFQLLIRSHLREDDIVALLDDEEEESWDPRERFIFSL